MKKQKIFFAIFSIVIAVYIALSLLLTAEKNTAFWIGFSFVLFSLIIMGTAAVLSGKRRSAAFPIEVSVVTFSFIYVATVFVINLLFGDMFQLAPKVFLSIHVICFALFAILTLLMQLTKAGIVRQNSDANGKICEAQILIYDFEKIKSRLSEMAEIPRKKSMALMDGLLDELKFSDFSTIVDVADLDDRIRAKALSLSAEVDNLIEIHADDLETFEASVNEIRQLIKDRNRQIKLLSNGI